MRLNSSDSIRFLVIIGLIILTGVPGIHKLLGGGLPSWFVGKFEQSIIGRIPFGLLFSFYLILLIELLIPVLLIIALIRREYLSDMAKPLLNKSVFLVLVLFLILFFGSFLVEDYENGFLDFMYFSVVVLLRDRVLV